MEIYKQPAHFEVRFDYLPSKVKAVKAITGAKWRPDLKCWTLPLTAMHDVERLEKKYPNNRASTAEAPEQYGEIPPMPELDDQSKEILRAELLRQPYHYQEQG